MEIIQNGRHLGDKILYDNFQASYNYVWHVILYVLKGAESISDIIL